MSTTNQQDSEEPIEFPVADIRERPSAQKLLASKMWWITLVCTIVALVLAWHSMPQTGPQITITFPQGHGLKPGDALRYRGIDVGRVQSTTLKSDLDGIAVAVELDSKSANLCREGSRFWVVRPRVGLTAIEGLDTVVGARYIAVSPGPPDSARQHTFEGLVAAPPDEFSDGGLELTLKAESRSGLNPGAPVSWRGVQVGQVLSVGLSPDASQVNVGIRIGAAHRRLVKSNSRFWVTSGLGVHVGLSGIDLNADSLASLALGGLSFITPVADEPLSEVHSGYVFALNPAVDARWLESTMPIPLIDVHLPETVAIEGNVETSFLGIRRHETFSASGILLRTGTAVSLLTSGVPINRTDEKMHSPELHVRQPGLDGVVVSSSLVLAEPDSGGTGIQLFEFPHKEPGHVVDASELLRRPKQPEECCVCRTVFSEGDSSSIIHSIGGQQLTVRDGIWMLNDGADLSAWNGAPVVAFRDGRIIGVLTTTGQGTAVVPIPAHLSE